MSEHHSKDAARLNVLQSAKRFLLGKSASQAARAPRTAEEIQAWLLARLSRELKLDADRIDVCEPLASYGLDSRAALSLSGEMEEWLGRKLSPTLVWDYPTIEEIALHLAPGDDVPEVS